MVDVQLMGVGCGGVMIMKGMVRTMADLASGVIGSVAQVAAFGHVAMGNVAQSCSGHSLSASWTHLLHINGRMSPSYLHGHKMGTSAYCKECDECMGTFATRWTHMDWSYGLGQFESCSYNSSGDVSVWKALSRLEAVGLGVADGISG